MTFDERGRIWITESLEYPAASRRPGPRPRQGPRRHRRRRQGRQVHDLRRGAEHPLAASPSATAASGSPTAPDILFLQDTDGDGKADKQEVVVTGFGRDDTHELPNSLTWGPDGWLYGLNGVFNPSRVEHQRQGRIDFTCALFRIHPADARVRGLLRRDEQPLGHRLRRRGERLRQRLRDRPPLAPDRDRLLPPPGRAVSAVHLEDRVDRQAQAPEGGLLRHPLLRQRRLSPSSTASKLYMGNIHGDCINVDALRARRLDLLRRRPSPISSPPTTPGSCRSCRRPGPTAASTSSTGTTATTATRTPTATPTGIDRLKGRLYRVRYKDTPRAAGFDLAKETDDQLIERLQQPERLLSATSPSGCSCERNDAGEPGRSCEALVLDDKAPRKARMHALWALVGTGRSTRLPPAAARARRPDASAPGASGRPGTCRQVDPTVREKVVVAGRRPVARRAAAGGDRRAEDRGRRAAARPARRPRALRRRPAHPAHRLAEPPPAARRAGPTRSCELASARRLEESADPGASSCPGPSSGCSRAPDADPKPLADLFGLLIARMTRTRPGGRGNALATARRHGSRPARSPARGSRRCASGSGRSLSTILAGAAEGPLYLDAALLAASWKDPAGSRPRAKRSHVDRASRADGRLQALEALIARGRRRGPRRGRPDALADPQVQLAPTSGARSSPRSASSTTRSVAEVVLAHYPEHGARAQAQGDRAARPSATPGAGPSSRPSAASRSRPTP